MSHTRLFIATTIIAIAIIAVFVLSVPHTRDVADTSASDIASSTVPLISLKDTFNKGIHTITGSIEAPDACSTTTSEATLQGNASTTESILVEISVPSDAGVCLQLPTATSFETTLEAPEDLPLTVLINGSLATTSVI